MPPDWFGYNNMRDMLARIQSQAQADWMFGGGPGNSGIAGPGDSPNVGSPNVGSPAQGPAQGPSPGAPSSGQVGPLGGYSGINSGQIGPTQGAFADPGITGAQTFGPNQFGWGLMGFTPAQTNQYGFTPAEVAQNQADDEAADNGDDGDNGDGGDE